MKYIKAKDGIYDKIDETLVLASKPPQYELRKNGKFVDYIRCKDCILGDTIEELCDAFVLETEGKITTYDKAYFICFSEDWYHNYLKAFDMGGMLGHEMSVNGYGAIHVKDKGLIYVAKMNDKGKLELL